MTGRASRWIVSILLRRISVGSLVIVEDGERHTYGSGSRSRRFVCTPPESG